MSKAANILTGLFRVFFAITIDVFIILYLQWFRLTPLMLNGHNDSDGAYVLGIILFAIYIVSGILVNLTRRKLLAIVLFIPYLFVLWINFLHVRAYFPSLENDVVCNGSSYYITWGHPFGDYQWTNYTMTKWDGIFSYETSFFGYTPSAGPFKIICDEKKNEANFVKTKNDVLVYTDGENPRSYDEYTGIRVNDRQYFLEWQCNDWVPSTCGSETYTLYQCNSDFKLCDPLPLRYTTDNTETFVFEANTLTNEINLYDDFDDNPKRMLIFTWGEHPRCYAEGCEFLEKK